MGVYFAEESPILSPVETTQEEVRCNTKNSSACDRDPEKAHQKEPPSYITHSDGLNPTVTA